ncbi:MAG: arsenosugar biosynthesis radical SAM protein ArsS [Desulfobacterales bacterium]|nr:arsenosugar biosynthesis radical SAM protein ArsS [Desulfobacterales bacterium]
MTLAKHGLKLLREKTRTLQVNVGLLCNQTCQHCHLDAGPNKIENMDIDTLNNVAAYAHRSKFEVIDITGGAPELNPNISEIVARLSPLAPRIMLRSNLSALNDGKRDELMSLLKSNAVVIFASFPSLNLAQTEAQRGAGIFKMSIDALRKLNALGYGREGSGLELNLVSNPTGAFLPPSQFQTEKRFKQVLEKKWGVVFNQLFTFANVPLGRFRKWLVHTGNLDRYLQKLAYNFNPCAVEGVMCRTLVSVSWDGYLFDCDFNLARGMYMAQRKTHVSEMSGPPVIGNPIVTADHCYTCAAGSGFT